MNPLGDLLERSGIRIDSDVKLVRILAGGLIHKETVSGPYIDNYPVAGKAR